MEVEAWEPTISPYFMQHYGFDTKCSVAPFTSDKPATILALPLRPMHAMVSPGTSTTSLMSRLNYKAGSSIHFFNYSTTPVLYTFMLCYRNGVLAREHVREAINQNPTSKAWTTFDRAATDSPWLN